MRDIYFCVLVKLFKTFFTLVASPKGSCGEIGIRAGGLIYATRPVLPRVRWCRRPSRVSLFSPSLQGVHNFACMA